MPTVTLYDFHGEAIGEEELKDSVFAAPLHTPAMHQVVVAQLANRRVGTHDTKRRSDVRGGGRKPYRQKHTGRARRGTMRSPINVGGGVAHGPHPRDYSQKVNRKVRRLAMRSALSLKVRGGDFRLFMAPELDKPSTKDMMGFLERINVKGKTLVVTGTSRQELVKSASNIPGTRVIHVDSINVYDILGYTHLVMTSDAVRKVEEVLG